MDGLDSYAKGLSPKTDFSRRAVVLSGIASGFALAVQPVSADTIITDTQGLTAGDVTVKAPDREIPGYRAMPAKGGPFPTVLVVQEVFGLHEHIKDICRRLAKAGYFAAAPALYVRQGDVMSMADIQEIVAKVVSKVPDAQVASDFDAAVSWAHGQKEANTAKLGITGFCWGGRQVWLYAIHNPAVKAAVAWYGPLAGNTDALRPKRVLDLVEQINVPVLGLYGGADQLVALADIEKMRDALKKANKPCEIVIYPGTPHGFNADYRPSYRPEQAKDGWKRMLAWYKEHGVA